MINCTIYLYLNFYSFAMYIFRTGARIDKFVRCVLNQDCNLTMPTLGNRVERSIIIQKPSSDDLYSLVSHYREGEDRISSKGMEHESRESGLGENLGVGAIGSFSIRFRISSPRLTYPCFTAQSIQPKYRKVMLLTASIMVQARSSYHPSSTNP